MNKVEIKGKVHSEPRIVQNETANYVVILVQTVDENGFKTTFPTKAWRETAQKLANVHKGDDIHFIGKIARYKPKKSDNWVTDVEITDVL